MNPVNVCPYQGESAASLLHKRLTATPLRLREHLVALAFVAEGLPVKVVAHRLGRNRGTVEAWGQRFKAMGSAACSPSFAGSRAPGSGRQHWSNGGTS
jgi:transposase